MAAGSAGPGGSAVGETLWAAMMSGLGCELNEGFFLLLFSFLSFFSLFFESPTAACR